MNYLDKSLEFHKKLGGKIEVVSRIPVSNREELSLAYTPGVAAPCLEIQKNPNLSYELTRRWNTIAVVTDGTAVLGLGDIGPEAGMPVMEGKCVLFKTFGDVDAFPLCIRTKDADEIVNAVSLLAGSFGGVNLEDISAPRCFEIERKLKERCDIPIFHDDQHGTAVVVLAALKNALKLAGKKLENVKIIINGAGAAGISVARLLLSAGAQDIILCGRDGAIYDGQETVNAEQKIMAKITNKNLLKGSLDEIISNADVFIGLSVAGVLKAESAKKMASNSIIFALANPIPEIMPDEALKAGAYIVGSGRSDFDNQINNVLAFPGIFRGTLDARASDINEAMLIAAADAIATAVNSEKLNRSFIIPPAFDKGVHSAVAKAVEKAAFDSGTAKKKA